MIVATAARRPSYENLAVERGSGSWAVVGNGGVRVIDRGASALGLPWSPVDPLARLVRTTGQLGREARVGNAHRRLCRRHGHVVVPTDGC